VDAKQQRRLDIFDAAYTVMAQKGYKGTSMLAVARAAGASNETMYNWFGNKQGLFAAMIEENARSASGLLSQVFEAGADPLKTLEIFGATLLELISGEKAIALNRAAAADIADGGILGDLIAEHGRRKVVPMVARTFEAAQLRGLIRDHEPGEVAEIYIALLLADIQIRRVIGVTGAPEKSTMQDHSQRVNELILELFGTRKHGV
jgi:AcrR family transcriptional regulator